LPAPPTFLYATAQIVALTIAGWLIVPSALDAWAWVSAKNDPAALTELGLKAGLTPARLQSELDAALGADDVDLAASLVALAEQQGMEISSPLRERYAAATAPAELAKRGANDFYQGVVNGEAASGAGLAGVVAGDLTGIGDVRDLVHEGKKIMRGEEPDHLVLGLAAAGLAVTGAAVASVGAMLPARTGVSTIRAAAKSGRLSRPLAANVGRLMHDAVDTKAVTVAAAAAARFDLVAARSAALDAVRPAALARLRDMASDVAIIGRRAGVRGAQEALAVTRDAAEVRRAARLAETRGVSVRAVLKFLGRGALVLTTAGATLFGWVVSGVAYLWLAFAIAVALARRAIYAVGWIAMRLLSSVARGAGWLMKRRWSGRAAAGAVQRRQD
jgi:hypothetical protein